MAKLTEREVLEMRRRHAQGETTRDLAYVYGVVPSTIARIVRRVAWRHVPLAAELSGGGV